MKQIQINSINDIIHLVETNQLTELQFQKVVEQTLNCFCLGAEPLSKQDKISNLILWRDKWNNSGERPIFFETINWN
jgi:sulfatase maturation enzyme AslB (radical SAM superfamily)